MDLESQLEILEFCDGTSLKMHVNGIVSPMYREQPNTDTPRPKHEIMSLHHPPPCIEIYSK